MISNPNHESHKDELELLQNILFEQITINEDSPNYDFDISIKLDAESPKLNFILKINLPDEYPNVHPIYEVSEQSNILPSSRIKTLNEKIKEFAEENLGFPMIYQIYELVKDYGNEQEEALNNENISRLTLEEEAKRNYNNKIQAIDKSLIETKTFTPVTKDSFEVWFKKFYGDRKKLKKNAEIELRMTGREYFMNLKNIKTSEIENEGEDDEDAGESTSTNVNNNTEDKSAMFFDAEAFEENIDDIDFDEEIDIDAI